MSRIPTDSKDSRRYRSGTEFTQAVRSYNRWGAKVFESDNYTNDWNGISEGVTLGNAKRLPSGTYYYIVILENSGLKPFTGAIYLGTK